MLMILKVIRQVLGNIIIFINFIVPPKRLKRNKDAQTKVDQACENLTLYHFRLCPFCVKVRRKITALSLPITLKDAKANKDYEAELIAGGGRRKVPCLRIQNQDKVTWLYESSTINAFLEKRFSR